MEPVNGQKIVTVTNTTGIVTGNDSSPKSQKYENNGLCAGTPEWHQKMEGTEAFSIARPYCDMDVDDYGGCKALSAAKYHQMLEDNGLLEYASGSVTNYITLPDAINSLTTLLVKKQTAEAQIQRQNLEENAGKPDIGL